MAGRRLTAIHVGVKEAPEGSQRADRHRGWRRDQLSPTAAVRFRHPLGDLRPGPVRKDDDKAAPWLLVLDDWGLASLSGQGRHDLLEVLDDRYARRGTILASQLPVEHRHDAVGDPTFGDAILDRLLNNAHRITLKGGSMRRLYDSTKETPTTPNHT